MDYCKFDKYDCKNCGYDEYCVLCFNADKYIPIKKKQYGIKKNTNKQSNRMGSKAEMINHNNLEKTLKTEANMTPNSGAGKIKGDESIKGLINWMFESKTQEIERARGHKQFTIKREWLDKLAKEAPRENMEFWSLVFSFKDNDEQLYAVMDQKLLYDCIATMVEDRKIAKSAQSKIDVANKHRELIEAENVKLHAEIDYLKALLKDKDKKEK